MWIKIALAIIVLFAIIIGIGYFTSNDSEPNKSYTYQETIARDDARLRADPNVAKVQAQQQEITADADIVESASTDEVKMPEFRELSIEEEVDAQRLFEMALAERKMGRLPVVTYKNMVDYCRQIIEKFPGSEYAWKAKRMLADIPERYREQYEITDEELKF